MEGHLPSRHHEPYIPRSVAGLTYCRHTGDRRTINSPDFSVLPLRRNDVDWASPLAANWQHPSNLDFFLLLSFNLLCVLLSRKLASSLYYTKSHVRQDRRRLHANVGRTQRCSARERRRLRHGRGSRSRKSYSEMQYGRRGIFLSLHVDCNRQFTIFIPNVTFRLHLIAEYYGIFAVGRRKEASDPTPSSHIQSSMGMGSEQDAGARKRCYPTCCCRLSLGGQWTRAKRLAQCTCRLVSRYLSSCTVRSIRYMYVCLCLTGRYGARGGGSLVRVRENWRRHSGFETEKGNGGYPRLRKDRTEKGPK